MPSPGGLALVHPEVVRAVHREGVGLHERARVHQDVEPLARGELALVVLLCGGVRAARLQRRLAPFSELLDPVLDGPLVRGRLLGLGHAAESRGHDARTGWWPAQQPLTGQPAAFQPPAACTIRIVTIEFERPFFALRRQLPDAFASTSCTGRATSRPTAGTARGTSRSPRTLRGPGRSHASRCRSPASRRRRTGPKRSTAQVIRRRIRCATDSPDARTGRTARRRAWRVSAPSSPSPRTRGRVTTVARNRFGTRPTLAGVSRCRPGRRCASTRRDRGRGTPRRRGSGATTHGR